MSDHKTEYRHLTSDELAIIEALRKKVHCDCNDAKRIQRMARWKRVSPKGQDDLFFLAHKYRRQLSGFPSLPLPSWDQQGTEAVNAAGYRTRGQAAAEKGGEG